MRKLATLFIVLTVLGSFSVFASANTNLTSETTSLTTETESNINGENCCRDNHVHGKDFNIHSIWLNRGQACVSISGDGSSDLDLFVYDGDGHRLVSDGYNDDERICINIYRSGYFRVDVVNRGIYGNNYWIRAD